jgi:hypothetical protein
MAPAQPVVERAGREANLSLKADPHMLRHVCGYARDDITRRIDAWHRRLLSGVDF